MGGRKGVRALTTTFMTTGRAPAGVSHGTVLRYVMSGFGVDLPLPQRTNLIKPQRPNPFKRTLAACTPNTSLRRGVVARVTTSHLCTAPHTLHQGEDLPWPAPPPHAALLQHERSGTRTR